MKDKFNRPGLRLPGYVMNIDFVTVKGPNMAAVQTAMMKVFKSTDFSKVYTYFKPINFIFYQEISQTVNGIHQPNPVPVFCLVCVLEVGEITPDGKKIFEGKKIPLS